LNAILAVRLMVGIPSQPTMPTHHHNENPSTLSSLPIELIILVLQFLPTPHQFRLSYPSESLSHYLPSLLRTTIAKRVLFSNINFCIESRGPFSNGGCTIHGGNMFLVGYTGGKRPQRRRHNNGATLPPMTRTMHNNHGRMADTEGSGIYSENEIILRKELLKILMRKRWNRTSRKMWRTLSTVKERVSSARRDKRRMAVNGGAMTRSGGQNEQSSRAVRRWHRGVDGHAFGHRATEDRNDIVKSTVHRLSPHRPTLPPITQPSRHGTSAGRMQTRRPTYRDGITRVPPLQQHHHSRTAPPTAGTAPKTTVTHPARRNGILKRRSRRICATASKYSQSQRVDSILCHSLITFVQNFQQNSTWIEQYCTHLDLSGASWIDDACLDRILKLTQNVQYLNISSLIGISPGFVPKSTKLKHLESVIMDAHKTPRFFSWCKVKHPRTKISLQRFYCHIKVVKESKKHMYQCDVSSRASYNGQKMTKEANFWATMHSTVGYMKRILVEEGILKLKSVGIAQSPFSSFSSDVFPHVNVILNNQFCREQDRFHDIIREEDFLKDEESYLKRPVLWLLYNNTLQDGVRKLY